MKKTLTILSIISFVLLLPLLTTGCVSIGFSSYSGSLGVHRGNGIRETREYNDLAAFSTLVLEGGTEVRYVNSDKHYVTIETDENLFEFIGVEAANGVLHIRELGGISAKEKGTQIVIGAPGLEGMEVHGAIDFTDCDPITAEYFDLDVSGAVNANFEIEAKSIRIDGSGATNIVLKGSCDSLRVDISGAGNVDTKELTAKSVDAQISGTGFMKLYASESMVASVSGAGAIEYWGDPSIVKTDMSGLGSISAGK